jgi:ATP-dependent Lhr-like helicase
VAAEEVEGGFTSLYPVFAMMEEQGQVRRGYFVDGLGGAQFASPGAVDRLRATTDPITLLLAATDPANPYGAALPWPTSPGRLARVSGAHVVIEGGELRAFIDHGKLTSLGPLPDGLPDLLAGLAKRVRRFEIREVDGQPTSTTPMGTALVAAGWRPTPKGLRP